jgi:hypothetical protein
MGIFINSDPISQKTHIVCTTRTNQLIPIAAIISAHLYTHRTYINKQWRQSAELLLMKQITRSVYLSPYIML